MNTLIIFGAVIVLIALLFVFLWRYIDVKSLRFSKRSVFNDFNRGDVYLGFSNSGSSSFSGGDSVEFGPVRPVTVESEYQYEQDFEKNNHEEYSEAEPEADYDSEHHEFEENEAQSFPADNEFVDEPQYLEPVQESEPEIYEEESVTEDIPDYEAVEPVAESEIIPEVEEPEEVETVVWLEPANESYAEPAEIEEAEPQITENFDRVEVAEEDLHEEVNLPEPRVEKFELPNFQNTDERLIDLVAWLPEGQMPLFRNYIMACFNRCETRPNKPYVLLGQNVDTGNWVDLEADDSANHYSDLVLTLQLVDENGPVDERDWLNFTNMVLEFSSALSRDYRFSMSMQETLEEAKLLNEMTAQFDQQAVMILKPANDDQFSVRGLEYIARECGMEQVDGNTYSMNELESQGPQPLFSLVNVNNHTMEQSDIEMESESSTRQALVLVSNLPCVKNPQVALDAMFETAEELKDRLSVELLDQNLNPIDRSSLNMIKDYIEELAEDMNTFGVPPGSQVALRLFKATADEAVPPEMYGT